MSAAVISPRVLELLRFTEAHRRHSDAIARVTGEQFNVFQILGIGHLEVKTHSPILAELMNPHGSHGQGAVFLRLFTKRFGIADFDSSSSSVVVAKEYYAGPVTDKSGGRIDILAKDGKYGVILIENKIYAGDQDNQMERYRDFSPSAHLFYLTIKGQQPSNQSEVPGLRCISYEHDILSWLNDCRKEAACAHTLREIISQYIHLIETLTNQSTATRMNQELIEAVIKDEESLRAFETLCSVKEPVRIAAVAKLDKDLSAITERLQLERTQEPLPYLGNKDSEFNFSSATLRKLNLQIGFAFDKGSYQECYFGFTNKTGAVDSTVVEALKAEFRTRFRPDSTAIWPAWTWWDAHRDWNKSTFPAIISGRFAADLEVILKSLVEIAAAVCLKTSTNEAQ